MGERFLERKFTVDVPNMVRLNVIT